MKKKLLLLSLIASTMISFLAGCTLRNPLHPTETRETQDLNDYYGCPNSKRVKKLNTRKDRR